MCSSDLIFKGNFYLELQQNGVPQQMLVNQRFQELSKDLGIPLIATADCHYLTQEEAFSQEVLLAIQTGRTLEDPSAQNIVSDEFYFKPQAKMIEEFSYCPQAIENTRLIAEKCSFEFKFDDDKGKKIYHFPKFEPPGGKSADEFLIDSSKAGLERILSEKEELEGHALTPEQRKKYQDRLEKELKVITSMGFTGYFLIVSDFIDRKSTRLNSSH